MLSQPIVIMALVPVVLFSCRLNKASFRLQCPQSLCLLEMGCGRQALAIQAGLIQRLQKPSDYADFQREKFPHNYSQIAHFNVPGQSGKHFKLNCHFRNKSGSCNCRHDGILSPIFYSWRTVHIRDLTVLPILLLLSSVYHYHHIISTISTFRVS